MLNVEPLKDFSLPDSFFKFNIESFEYKLPVNISSFFYITDQNLILSFKNIPWWTRERKKESKYVSINYE